MKKITSFFLNQWQRKLNKIESSKEFSKNFLSDYEIYLPKIKELYRDSKFWHGTGRYQYTRIASSRYSKINHGNTYDILDSIISSNGLKPHSEPWLRKMTGISLDTVSLSAYRMYAKLYAGLYLCENETLSYEYGNAKTWFRILFLVQILDSGFLTFVFSKSFFKLVSFSSYSDAKKWVASLRKDTDQKFSLYNAYKIRSDIPNNFSVLIGIKNIPIVHFNKSMERLEQRTKEKITLSQITHIEVPLKNIEETSIYLKSKNINLELIPLEYGERYCREIPFKLLVGFDK